jgi:hypothetical protein
MVFLHISLILEHFELTRGHLRLFDFTSHRVKFTSVGNRRSDASRVIFNALTMNCIAEKC